MKIRSWWFRLVVLCMYAVALTVLWKHTDVFGSRLWIVVTAAVTMLVWGYLETVDELKFYLLLIFGISGIMDFRYCQIAHCDLMSESSMVTFVVAVGISFIGRILGIGLQPNQPVINYQPEIR